MSLHSNKFTSSTCRFGDYSGLFRVHNTLECYWTVIPEMPIHTTLSKICARLALAKQGEEKVHLDDLQACPVDTN